MTPARWTVLVCAVLIGASSALSGFAGLTAWLPLAVACLPWLLVVTRRRGVAFAATSVLITLLVVLLFALMIGHAFGWGVFPTVLSTAVLGGAAGVVVMARSGSSAPGRPALLLAAFAAVGALGWSVALAVASVLPTGASLAWAMNGDSANNMLFARVVLADHGIAVGAGENPVPLPAGLMAAGMSAGRDALPSADVFAHDLIAFVALWAATIVAVCILAAVAVLMSVPRERPVLRAVAAVLASLLPLSWLVVGYPIEYGFFNTHLVMLVVLASWIVFRASDDAPAAALTVLLLACTLLLAIWGPMVLFPGLLALVIVVRRSRVLLATRGVSAALLLLGLVQLLAYGLLVTLPSFLAQSDALAAAGGAYPFSRWGLIALVVGTVVLAIAGRSRSGSTVMWGGLAWAAAAIGGWFVLLFAARQTADPFVSYYPVKFAWLASVILLVAVVALAAGIGARLSSRLLPTAGAVLAIGVFAVAALETIPATRTGYERHNPVERVLRGTFWIDGDAGPRQVMEYVDLERPTILWRTSDPNEGQIDFWVLQMQADSLDGNFELRKAAYSLTGDAETDELCDILDLIDVEVRVLTDDADLASEVAASCSVEADVELR